MTDALFLLFALALTLAAAVGLYLAQVRLHAWSPRRRRGVALGALGALAAAVPCYARATGPAVGPCCELVVLMLALVALPYLRAWRTLTPVDVR